MPLIASGQLLTRFVELLNASTHVDIAVAWVGPGLAVEALIERAERTEVRLAVGLSGNATEPATLRRLMEQENVQLRVAPAPRGGIFHPKFYRFRSPRSAICWIGSVNFTRRGFGANAELVKEFRDRENAGGTWFDALWQGLDADPGPAIDHYEEHYRPPRPGVYGGDGQNWQGELPNLGDIDTWADFVDGLHTLDDYCHHRGFSWDVLGDTFSYLHTIGAGRDVVRRGNWQRFTRHHRNVLLGLPQWDNGGSWGLLGNMGMARAAIGAFTPPVNHGVLNDVLVEVGTVVEHEGENFAGFAEAAQEAMEGIMELQGFGPAVASRILTLARPDGLVSVNTASEDGLGAFADMQPAAQFLTENYEHLLETLYDTQWFQEPEPDNAFHREIWRCRAALVDAFVYIPTI